MNKGKDEQKGSAELRRLAEARLISKRKDQRDEAEDPATTPEMQRLVQELQIHQIQLEMQNEELKKARDEAEAERERYLDLYDFAPVGYLTLDVDGVIRQVNLTGARLLGLERSLLLNRRFGHFVSEADGPAFHAFLKRAFEKRDKESCAVSLGREGSHVHIEATITGDGRECRIAILDWTERKKAQDEVRRLHKELNRRNADHIEQLEAANKELDAFCYSVSHDLQTPLRAIDGYSRMILRKDADQFSEETRNRFGVIRGSIQKMDRLIHDLLAFSRLGKSQLSLAEVEMEDVVKEVWEELKAANPDRSMTLRNEGLPPAMGDPALIRQVVGNLLANAVKFAKSRAEIVVEVGGYPKGNETVFAIKDNGSGFDMAYYGKLFGMFQRLHNPDEYEGTGVGLAIAQRIINRHGGRIWAEGEVDKGATFFFTLPDRDR
jgi:PAS domain S-box-containing protein